MGGYSDDYRSEEEEKRQQIFIPTERPIVGKSCWGVVTVKGNVDFLLLQPTKYSQGSVGEPTQLYCAWPYT